MWLSKDMFLQMKKAPVNQLRMALALLVGLQWGIATAQPGGEAGEPSPEERDAAFTSEDAAREAAAFSAAIIDQDAVDPLGEMTDAADLVFRGNVSAQSVVYDADGVPFTHTTLTIQEILKGAHPDGDITVVQEGGPARDHADKILLVSSSMLFNAGEEDLLFIDLDADNPNPHQRVTVNQRYRIYEGRVYSEDGRGITIEPVGSGSGRRLMLSDDRHPAAYFRQIRIGGHALTRNFGSDVGKPDAVARPQKARERVESVVRSYTDSVDVQTFSEAVAK
jgi:hypothetical protein